MGGPVNEDHIHFWTCGFITDHESQSDGMDMICQLIYDTLYKKNSTPSPGSQMRSTIIVPTQISESTIFLQTPFDDRNRCSKCLTWEQSKSFPDSGIGLEQETVGICDIDSDDDSSLASGIKTCDLVVCNKLEETVAMSTEACSRKSTTQPIFCLHCNIITTDSDNGNCVTYCDVCSSQAISRASHSDKYSCRCFHCNVYYTSDQQRIQDCFCDNTINICVKCQGIKACTCSVLVPNVNAGKKNCAPAAINDVHMICASPLSSQQTEVRVQAVQGEGKKVQMKGSR